MNKLMTGSLLLILCNLFYLAWWIVAFKPGVEARRTWLAALLVGTATVVGIIGVVQLVGAIRSAVMKRSLFNGMILIVCGFAAYILLILITWFFMHRQITLELLLIDGWVILELSLINLLYGTEKLSFAGAVIFIVILAAAVIAVMYFYMAYYNLEKEAAFIDGTIPLIITAAFMAARTVFTLMAG